MVLQKDIWQMALKEKKPFFHLLSKIKIHTHFYRLAHNHRMSNLFRHNRTHSRGNIPISPHLRTSISRQQQKPAVWRVLVFFRMVRLLIHLLVQFLFRTAKLLFSVVEFQLLINFGDAFCA